MTIEHHKDFHKGPTPLRPSYPGQDRRFGGKRPYWRRRFRYPYQRSPYQTHYYTQPVYVVKEVPTSSHWWYPSTWYHSFFHEGFENERNMNCGMLSVLCLIILVGYFSKNK